MPPMPEHLCKPLILARLDNLFNKQPERLCAFRDALQAGKSVAQIAVDFGVAVIESDYGTADQVETEPRLLAFEQAKGVLSPRGNGDLALNEQEHLLQDWFTPKNAHDPANPGGWWEGQHPSIETILRNGLIQLVDLVELKRAENGGFAVDSYWLCAGPDSGSFRVQVQCFIAWTKQQATFLILTPEHLFGQMHHALDPRRGARYASSLATELAKTSNIIVIKPNMHGETLIKPSFAAPA